MKIKFRTRFDPIEPIYSNPGDPIHIQYALQINDSGVENLVPVGEDYIPDEINSHADSVDIHNILARFNNGDVDALNARTVSYFDATQMPDNLAEMYRTVANGEYMFNTLPLDVRAKFNHSFTEFVSSIGTPEFEAAFSSPSTVNSDSKEVIDSES